MTKINKKIQIKIAKIIFEAMIDGKETESGGTLEWIAYPAANDIIKNLNIKKVSHRQKDTIEEMVLDIVTDAKYYEGHIPYWDDVYKHTLRDEAMDIASKIIQILKIS